MKRAALLVLAIALLTAAPSILEAPQDEAVIEAEYSPSEIYINHTDSTLLPATLTHRQDTEEVEHRARTIIRQTLGLTLGTHVYTIIAADTRGNQAAHSVLATARGDFEATLTQPSPLGKADTPSYDVTLTTQEAASCTWAYYAPGEPRSEHGMETTDGYTHTIPAFSRDNRFQKEETVPLLITCTAGGAQTRLIAPTGWGDAPQPLTTRITPTALTDITRETVTLAASSDDMTRCTLTSPLLEEDRHALPGLRAEWRDVARGDSTTYTIACTGARGQPLEPREHTAVLAGGAAPRIHINTPAVDDDTNVVLSAQTSSQARCGASIDEQSLELGPLSNRYLHQRNTTLSEGTHTLTVTCTDLFTQQTSTATKQLTVDATPPTLTFVENPLVCGDDTILTLRAQDATHVVIKRAETSVLREWRPQNGDVMTIHQGSLTPSAGAEVRAYAIDAAGNPSETVAGEYVRAQDQELCAYRGIEQHIALLEPASGGTSADAFDLVVQTEHPGTCTWSTDGDNGTFTTQERTHTATDFQQRLERGSEASVEVACTDPADQETTETFTIQWTSDAPEIAATVEPQTVTDPLDPYATVTVTADQEVECTLADAYDGEYATEHAFRVAVPYGTPQREVTAYCRNRVPLEANDTVTVGEDYPSTLQATLESPTVSRTEAVDVVVRTTLPASCTINNTPLQRTGLTHDGTITLPEGSTNTTLRCTDEYNPEKSVEQTHVFLVDTEPPSAALTSKALTCGTDSYTARANVTDNDRVASATFSFAGETATVSEINDGKATYRFKNLQLTDGEVYTLNITATDRAGNNASVTGKEIEAVNESTAACDTSPPKAYLLEKETNEGVELTLVCSDDVECADEYKLGTGSPDGECTPTTRRFSDNETVLVTETSRACWEVSDVNENTATGEQDVVVPDRPDHCTSGEQDGDETGLDCGGSCAPCEPAQPCTDDTDCQSGACSDEGVCEETSCENGELDGKETDVDCGGPRCEPCGDGQTCEANLDCGSGVCADQACQEATCSDKKKNGAETDVDCGGPACGPCENGASCAVNADCTSGVCSDGDCTEEELREGSREETPGQTGEQRPPAEESSLLALILILVGALLVMGGGGYIYYERSHPPARPKTPTRPPATSKQPSTPASAGTTDLDLGESKLREEARKKRREKRQESREDLVDAFEEESTSREDTIEEFSEGADEERERVKTKGSASEQETPAPTNQPPTETEESDEGDVFDALSHLGNEDVHAYLKRADNPEALEDLAHELLEEDKAEKHQVASALKDLHAAGEIDEEDEEWLRGRLDL